MLDELGSKYVIVDTDTANGKFPTIVIWAGKSESQFMELYDIDPDEGRELTTLYYPEYYRSMCSRLYNFGGEAVVPHNSTVVISYEEVKFLRGTIKQISSNETFVTYEEALEYLGNQTAPNYRFVGEDPFISPVPLEELEHYKLVHRSDPEVIEEEEEEEQEEEEISYVKIFEYLP
jgi:asparagine N-glycosylation enzyme membrane subunit Stt3